MIITIKDNFIHSIEIFEIKNKNDKYNTLIHDVKMIHKSLDKVIVNNKLTIKVENVINNIKRF